MLTDKKGKIRPLVDGLSTSDNQTTEIGILNGIKTDTDNISANSIPLIVTDAINQTSFDLNAAPFSAVTNISNDYIFDNLILKFTTNQSKTITVTASDGTILWGGSVDTSAANLGYNTTAQNFNIYFGQAIKGGENITVAVTQTGGACLMDCILHIKQGSQNLTGNPVIAAGNNIIGKVKIVDESNDPATDDIDDAVIMITPEHANTHKGLMFSLASGTTITAGTTAYFQLKTGAKVVHFKQVILTLIGNTSLTYQMIEAPTITDGTSALTPINRNRNSANTTTTTWFSNPTGISEGTVLNQKLLAGTNQSISAQAGDEREFDLKPNTNYIFSLQNTGAQSANFLGEGYWYEI